MQFFNSSKYRDLLVDYKESPTGKAYIGIAKRPIVPNKTGHGFIGVLLQNEKRNRVQCSICGKWLDQLSGTHLTSHRMNSEQYKTMFGLNITTGLVSDTNSWKRSSYMTGVAHHSFKKGNPFLGELQRNGRQRTEEEKNSRGVCDEQLKARTLDYILKHKKLPSTLNHGNNRHEPSWVMHTARRRFGTYNNALEVWGLPTRHKVKGGMLYLFHDKTELIIKRFAGYEVYENLFNLMMMKCDELRKYRKGLLNI
jgi:hypothetical protein